MVLSFTLFLLMVMSFTAFLQIKQIYKACHISIELGKDSGAAALVKFCFSGENNFDNSYRIPNILFNNPGFPCK